MAKESPKYWFKRRRFGWGWTPVTWQGWTSFLTAIGAVFIAGLMLPSRPDQPSETQLMVFFGIVVAALLFLIIITFIKGPRPHWRWGERSDDNPDEDF